MNPAITDSKTLPIERSDRNELLFPLLIIIPEFPFEFPLFPFVPPVLPFVPPLFPFPPLLVPPDEDVV
jgi:hypothetical protein